MKKVRVVLVMILCVLMLMNFSVDKISAGTPHNSAIIKEHLQGKIGSSFQRGMCLGFVTVQQEYCYGIRSGSCCAYNYGKNHIISTDINDIPVGADVFFSGGSAKCPSCGAICGHVGIYVGDGQLVHSIAMDTTGDAVVRKDTFEQLSVWGYTFTGWGWHAGTELEYKPEEYVEYDISEPESYPVMLRTLDYTSGTAQYGRDVLFVQQGLNALGYTVDSDAYYGPGCESVVKQFQEDNSISGNGVVNQQTWNLLTELLTKKYGVSERNAYNSAFIKDHLESQLGGSYPRGLCLSFVKVNQQYCYGMDSSSCCVQNYAAQFTDSGDVNNIPIGADVFFSGGSTGCPNCGRICGHIGIYVGDGYVVHSIAMSDKGDATIRKDTLSTLAGWGYTFTGWGWHGNVELQYKPDEYIRFDIKVPASYPVKFRNLSYNGTAPYGSDILFVQKALRDLGYSIDTDGYYGPGATSTVKKFQTDNNITATGVVDDNTWNKIIDLLTEKYQVEEDKKEFTVTYNMNGGVEENFSESVTEGDAYSITTSIPSKEGYTFGGWSKDPDAEVAEYVPGDTLSITEDVTYYAVWTDNVTISADINKDGIVNGEDLSILLSQYGRSY